MGHTHWGWVGAVLFTVAVVVEGAAAQVVPDQTLGAESSRVRNQRIRGRDGIERDSELIEGGAQRGRNLFHSFQQFDVPEGRGAYFSNPAEVRNIFSRVTGNDRSEILGTLGVLGDANLFFLNPNGILFGPNASLDISGSFLATTADRIMLGDQGFFSAATPEQSSLLAVDPGVLFFNQAVAQGGVINSTGTLAAGQDLTLAGQNLELQGQVIAGRNLTLQAQDTLRVRDSATAPFVAASGGQMLVQGNRAVDISALHHPHSGLVSGGDMVLRSANPVGGDAHYWSGGNFRIERLDGKLGNLYSPHDPVIRVAGDLTFNDYTGASLHILAGGFVYIPGTIFITGADAAETSIAENVTLSNGAVLPIDGSARPTLDIRAGVDPAAIGTPLGLIGTGDFTDGQIFDTATGAFILIGTVFAPGGQVFLTNQYQPNNALPLGSILIGGEGDFPGIFTFDLAGDGGSVVVDARNNIFLAKAARVDTGFENGRGGDVQLIAGGDIALDRLSRIDAFAGPVIDITSPVNPINNNRGGNINLSAGGDVVLEGSNSLLTAATVLTNGGGNVQVQANRLLMGRFSQITSATVGAQGEGNIAIQASDAVQIDGGNIGTFTFPTASANGGNISIAARELTLIGASEPDAGFGRSTGGDITSDTAGNGSAGNINLDVAQLRVLDGAQIRANTSAALDPNSTGNAGNITINASDRIEVSGRLGDDLSKIAASVNPGATGQGGNVLIETNRLIIRDEAQIQAGAFGAGQAGSVTIHAPESVEITATGSAENATGILTGPEGDQASGNGGTLNITTGQLTLSGDGAEISNEVDSEATGNAGNTVISVGHLTLEAGGQIRAGTLNTGQGGRLEITAADAIDLSGVAGTGEDEESSGIFVGTLGLADAGDLALTTSRLTIRDGAAITASTFGAGQDASIGSGGNITIAADSVEISGRSAGGISSNIASEAGSVLGVSNPASRAAGGNIHLTTGQLTVQDRGFISTQTVGAGNAGNLTVDATGEMRLLAGDLRTRTLGTGNAGNLTITAGQLTLQNGEATAATDRGGGQGGNVSVTVRGTTELIGNNGGFATSSFASGDAGNLTLQTERLIVRDGAGIITQSIAGGRSGNLTIIAPGSIEVTGGQFITGAEANATVNDNLPGAMPFDPAQTYFFPSRISAAVSAVSPDTPATNLAIETGQLTVSNGGEISTQTLGSSPGGRLSIRAPQLRITGTSSNLRSDLERSPAILSAQTSGTGHAGDIQLEVRQLQVADSAEISAASSGSPDRRSVSRGAPGSIRIQNADSVQLTANGEISTAIEPGVTVIGASTQGGNIEIQSHTLSLDHARITASTSGEGNAGNITVRDAHTVDLNNHSGIASTVNAGAVGNGGNIRIETDSLNLNRSRLTSSTAGRGDTGTLAVRANQGINLRQRSRITNRVESGATGDSRTIRLHTPNLTLRGDSQISAATASNGNAGNIRVDADTMNLLNSLISTAVDQTGQGRGGNITLNADMLNLGNSARITARTRGQGRAGTITVNADTLNLGNGAQLVTSTATDRSAGNLTLNLQEAANLNGNHSGIFANTTSDGNGGSITFNTPDFNLSDQARLSARSTGSGQAGDIRLNVTDRFQADNSAIVTAAIRSSGGSIAISPQQPGNQISLNNSNITTNSRDQGGNVSMAASQIRLRGDSDISTSSGGDGGNITLSADSVLAFDDSDILAQSSNQRGGNISLDTPVFFGQGYIAETEANSPDGNDRVDIDATGRTESGNISTPDTSFIQNSLADLPEAAIDPDALLANSCIARDAKGGTFLVTGAGGLPTRPGDASQSAYPTGTVRVVPATEAQPHTWQMGDPIVEPQGAYRLPNGQIVLSRECQSQPGS